MIAGQNKYWGKTIEDSIKIWSDVGVYHLVAKAANDTPLIKLNGEIDVENFERLGKLQDEYGFEFHIHPYNISVNVGDKEVLLDKFSDVARPIYKRFLEDIDEQIQKNDLYPLIVMHLPILDYPGIERSESEDVALNVTKDFLQNLELESNLALETMHDPYRNPGRHLLGYRTEHFTEVIGDRDYGICIDTGHLALSEEPLEKYLDLPYPVLSVHLDGNSGRRDSHRIATRDNIKDVELVEVLLKSVDGPIVLELHDHGYSRDEIGYVVDRTRKGFI